MTHNIQNTTEFNLSKSAIWMDDDFYYDEDDVIEFIKRLKEEWKNKVLSFDEDFPNIINKLAGDRLLEEGK